MIRTKIASFRLEQVDLDNLDVIVSIQKEKRSPNSWGPSINRTTVLKSLIRDEAARLENLARAKFEKELASPPKKKATSKTMVKKGKK